jgi:hypothetical protein
VDFDLKDYSEQIAEEQQLELEQALRDEQELEHEILYCLEMI